MLFLLLLLLTYTNLAYVTKIEDIFICINNTDCTESVESITNIPTHNPKIDTPVSEDPLNDNTKQDDSYVTITMTEVTTSLGIDLNVTSQTEIQSTVSTIPSPIIITSLKDSKNLTLEKKETCECNLIESSCDINCCCDVDCNQFHLSAFTHCQNYHVELYDSRYCYNRNFIQRNNTPFILEKLANNLFCILYDNLPSTYSIDNDLILQDKKDLWKAIHTKKYKWKLEDNKALSKYNLSKHYQYGDILWKLHEEFISPIELLQSGFTEICSFKRTLKYLENWKSVCIQNELTNVNQYLFPITFSNFNIISSLPSFNETFITEQFCPSNVCLSVRTHYCLNSFSTCNKTVIPGFCTNSVCKNILKGLKYIISHNGSAGINSIDAYFNIGDVSRAFYQSFEVQYDWVNSNKTSIFTRSGNPGYIKGKPIIVGVSRGNRSDEILFNKTDAFLTLPLAERNGNCGKVDRHTVAFGEDIKLRCSVKLLTDNFTAASCAELQNLTMYYLTKAFLLNVSQSNGIYVSKLGNFTNKDTANWLRITFDRIPQNVVTARTIGTRILCSGLITSIHLDVLYSTLPQTQISTNYKISGVGVTFNKEEDISWPKCIVHNCTNVLHVDILSYVSFHDISKPSKYYFVGGPNLDITLPYDFFYPFLNDSEKLKVPNIYILSAYVALFSINKIQYTVALL